MSNNPTRKANRKNNREQAKQPIMPKAMDNDIGTQVAGPDPTTAEDAFSSYTVRLYEKGKVYTVTLCDNNSQMALYQGKKEQAITFYTALKLKLSSAFFDFAILLEKAQQEMSVSDFNTPSVGSSYQTDYDVSSFNPVAPPTHPSSPIELKPSEFPTQDGGF